MSLTRLLITAVVVENRPVREVAAAYGVSRSWLYELLARYRAEGEAVFAPRSRRPKVSPTALAVEVTGLIVELREKLSATGLDAGPDTIVWHLHQHHGYTVSRATVSRYLVKHGLVVPEPKKRPKSSYTRFAAELPNECWQADFTHYRLTHPDGRPGPDIEILSWLDDCSRYALRVTGHVRVTGPIVLTEFRKAVATHGIPAATLTDNGMVFTTRLSGGSLRGTPGRNGFEHELRRLGILQKNSRPNHPTTCGKVERFQCATSHLVVSPAQPGGTRREVPGSDGLPVAERRVGDKSMPANQRPGPGVRDGALGDPRDMAKAGLPESQSPEEASSPPPERHLKPAPALR